MAGNKRSPGAGGINESDRSKECAPTPKRIGSLATEGVLGEDSESDPESGLEKKAESDEVCK